MNFDLMFTQSAPMSLILAHGENILVLVRAFGIVAGVVGLFSVIVGVWKRRKPRSAFGLACAIAAMLIGFGYFVVTGPTPGWELLLDLPFALGVIGLMLSARKRRSRGSIDSNNAEPRSAKGLSES